MGLFTWIASLFSTSQEEHKHTPEDELVRARDKKGRFVGDNPDTEKNEAYTKKAAKK
tara:strand:- start:624 stop:794 length:171 start_codon:yes stop_codon:yes gene_type:complete